MLAWLDTAKPRSVVVRGKELGKSRDEGGGGEGMSLDLMCR